MFSRLLSLPTFKVGEVPKVKVARVCVCECGVCTITEEPEKRVRKKGSEEKPRSRCKVHGKRQERILVWTI